MDGTFARPAGVTRAEASTQVLLVAPYAPRGGGMGRIMAYLAAQGPLAGVRFEMVESRGGGHAILSLWYGLSALLRILLAAVSKNLAIVHFACGDGGSLARKGALLVLARLLGLPAILHLHAADPTSLRVGMPHRGRAIIAFLFRRASHCIVLSPFWRQWLVQDLGVEPDRISIVRNGVPQPEVARCRSRGPVFTFVFAGNLLARKGLPDLLHALASIPPAASGSWRLLVAGGGESAEPRAWARTLGIAAHVHFLGWQERPAMTLLLAQADALVLPSHHEALPLVLLEAASLGVPAIATRVGAVPELFVDGQDALLTTPGDYADLRAALMRLMNDPALATYIGNNAYALYRRRFTMENFVAEIVSIYARIGAERQQGSGSFLKKRTKKLLLVAPSRRASWAPLRQHETE
jgi:glycosyltransferase involved in cell wall biosynthesis